MKIYGDLLTRFDTVEDIISIVKSSMTMKKPVAFSLEGEWGRGKTWIVDRVAEALMGIDLSQENKPKAKAIDSGDLLVFKYNAWEKDYYTEPLLAILITIIKVIYSVFTLCRDREKVGFIHGVRIGVRLMQELFLQQGNYS